MLDGHDPRQVADVLPRQVIHHIRCHRRVERLIGLEEGLGKAAVMQEVVY